MSNEGASVSLANVLNTGVRKHGKSILTNLAIAVKLTKLYQSSHQNVRDAIAELQELLQGFLRLQGSVDLMRIDDFLFLNDVRIEVDFGGYESFQFVIDTLTERDIGDVSFSSGLTQTELETLVKILNAPAPTSADKWGEFSNQLQGHTLPNISFSQHEVRHDHYEDVSKDIRLYAIQTYFKSIVTMGKALATVKTDRRANLKSLKTATQAIVDLTLDAQHMLVALTNVKTFGPPGANHAVNVAILSIAIGAKLGLSKRILGDLGIAALFHDVGKVKLSEEFATRHPSTFRGDEREGYIEHVYEGTDALLRQSMVNQIVKSMNVAFLHHYRFDRTGFPRLLATKEQNLFTRIVAVANAYDNATTPAGPNQSPASPEKILRDLMERGGTEFDGLMVKAFVNLMGLYPVGCMVRLSTGEIATVIAPPTNPRYLDRPTVRLVSDSLGMEATGTFNLLERDASGGFVRAVVEDLSTRRG